MRVAAVLVVVAATLAALAAATKTVDEITKAAPTYDWHAARQRVRDAMMNEVNAYSNVTSARLAIRTALRDKQRAVWLVSGRILVHEDFLRKGGMKNNLHARFVKSLIKESSKELRNFVYIFDQGATGGTRACDEHIPRLVIAKQHEAVHEGLTEHPEYTKYQFLLDLPGSTTGSYSRNLNHLWLMGAIVGIWHGPMTEPHGAAPCGNQPVNLSSRHRARHRADAGAGTTSLRWLGASEI